MLKQKLIKNLAPYVIVVIGLFFAGFISFLLVSPAESNKTGSENKVHGFATIVNVSTSSPEPAPSVTVVKNIIHQSPSPSPKISLSTAQRSESQSTNNAEASQTITPTPSPTEVPQTNQVNVSLNGSSNFSISVADGANQCDVLNKALADGKISSLNMRYDSNFGTYAVYQINGMGKDNSVWWTYTVDGQSPNQGCSYIKVKNNNNVEWKYIGS